MIINQNIIIFLPLVAPLIYLNIYGFSNIGVLLTGLSLFFIPIILYKKIVKINKQILIPIICIVLYSIYVINNNIYQGIAPLTGIYWWIILLILLTFYDNVKLGIKNILLGINLYFIISIAILTIDAYYRFFINVLDKSDIGRYAFKYGLIDMDSNFSGLYAVLCFYLVYSIGKIMNKSYLLYKILLFILVLSSLSVAAIATTISYLIWIKSKNIFLKILLIYIVFISFYFIMNLILSDGSGASKINLIVSGHDYISSLDMPTFLFGVGMNRGIINGIAPHLLVLKLIVEIGFIGFILFFLMILSFFYILKTYYLNLIIPYFILGLSVVSISNPVFSSGIILIYIVLKNKEKYFENNMSED